MKKYVLISIKEEYSERILEGTKTIELRKSKPNVNPGDYAIIYCTSPTKAIVGLANIKQIIIHTPKRMWRLYSRQLGINKADYFEYYGESEKAVGIVLSNVTSLSNRICLDIIRKHIPTFTPPQTYKYFANFVTTDRNQKFSLVPFS